MAPEMEPENRFTRRHIGPRPHDVEEMLGSMGLGSLEELIEQTLPESIRLKADLDLPEASSEHELLGRLQEIGAQNRVFRSYIGMGYHDTIVPGVIQRNILENPGWYTPYTPYQSEISQGTSRGTPELPDDGDRPHRDGDRQCLSSGRGHGGCRGDDHALRRSKG